MTRMRPSNSGSRAAHRAPAAPRSRHRRRRALIAGPLSLVLGAGGVLVAATASAAVPVFPDNVVAFPNRDFVSLEGFQDHLGEKAVVKVTRNGKVVGQSESTVAAGDVAFEVNHPGGVCWGAGAPADLQVTPDIVKGDVVSITFPDGTSAETTVGSGVASDAVQGDVVQDSADGRKVTVTGTIGTEINRDFIEQRIIDPALVDLIGKRDVRALPGPPTAAPKGGYTSGLTFGTALADGTVPYTATYVFDTKAAADVAGNAELGERLMSWQVQDDDGNRQGLTIAEFGEAGGPGMGGCPAGPSGSVATAGTVTVIPSADKMSATLNWSAAIAAQGASPVANYSVLAIAPLSGKANGEQAASGLRFDDTARSATIKNLDPSLTYTFEVRAITQDGASSAPFTVNTANAGGVQDSGANPALTLSPAPQGTTVVETDSVTASTTAGTQIWWSADAPVYASGGLTDTAKPYTGPIPVTAQTTLHFAALNAVSNVETVTGTFAPVSVVAPPLAPTSVVATGGMTSAQVRWVGSTNATSYEIAIRPSGTPTATPTLQAATSSPATVNLGKGSYSFTVTALNGTVRGGTSDPVTATVTGVVDRVSITSAKWKAGDFRIRGTASNFPLSGATDNEVQVHIGSATGEIIGRGTVTDPVAPATIGDFDIRLRGTAAQATRPARIWVTTNNGGVAGPFTVTNG